MSKMKNLTGFRFNKLTVIERDLSQQKGRVRTKWLCKCDCGNIISVVSTDLLRGHTQSCGCYHKSQASKSLTEIKSRSPNFHKSKTRAYRIWHGMMRRCNNPKAKFYFYYGGRGIKVCKRWHEYDAFLADMGEPGQQDTLDRIDSNGDYCPKNCRWATMQEQCNNRRGNLIIWYNGKKYSGSQFAKEFDIPYYYVRALYKRGMSGENIINMFLYRASK